MTGYLRDCCVEVLLPDDVTADLVLWDGDVDPFTGEEVMWPQPLVYWSNGTISRGECGIDKRTPEERVADEQEAAEIDEWFDRVADAAAAGALNARSHPQQPVDNPVDDSNPRQPERTQP